MSKKFSIRIARDTSREKVFAEIYFNNEEWAEISQETDELMIQFYSHPDKEYWEFSCEEALGVLERAKMKLLN